jgi:hypothetical protein
MCEVGSWVEMELNNPVEQFFEQGEHHVEFVISCRIEVMVVESRQRRGWPRCVVVVDRG